MGPGTELASNSFGVDSGERSGPAFTRLRAGRPNFGCYATPRNQPMSRWNSVPNLFKTANSPSWLLVIWRLAKRKPRESSREESRFHQLSGVKSRLHSSSLGPTVYSSVSTVAPLPSYHVAEIQVAEVLAALSRVCACLDSRPYFSRTSKRTARPASSRAGQWRGNSRFDSTGCGVRNGITSR